MECTGDVEGAFSVLHELLQNKLSSFTDKLLQNNVPEDDQLIHDWSELQTLLLSLIQLNQRNAGKMEEFAQ